MLQCNMVGDAVQTRLSHDPDLERGRL